MAKRKNTVFICSECGHQSIRWLGRCPECNAWESMIEERDVAAPASMREERMRVTRTESPRRLPDVEAHAHDRVQIGIGEFDRILGGGLVAGSAILIGGDPGIGKSTLLLQASSKLSEQGRKVLYVSAEESSYQIRMRSERLDVHGDNIFVVSETNLQAIRQHMQDINPDFTVVDSIQMIYSPDIASAPGSVAQVRDCAAGLIMQAKGGHGALALVGHVTKEGNIAGPRTLEHMVDTVLSFEGDRFHSFRILRTSKNRFGATSEIGIFEMTQAGLEAVENPSRLFINEYRADRPGSAIIPALEGTRVLLVEVQALIGPSPMASPRRRVTGIDHNRCAMLLAVLERRAGMRLSQQEVFLNIAGGVTVDEPAADLGACIAVASSMFDAAAPDRTVFIGEVGLGGEVRAVNLLARRLEEASRLGFSRALIPALPSGESSVAIPQGMQVVPIGDVREAITWCRTNGGM